MGSCDCTLSPRNSGLSVKIQPAACSSVNRRPKLCETSTRGLNIPRLVPMLMNRRLISTAWSVCCWKGRRWSYVSSARGVKRAMKPVREPVQAQERRSALVCANRPSDCGEGDWRNWGEMYSQALEGTPYKYGTLRQAVFVAGKKRRPRGGKRIT